MYSALLGWCEMVACWKPVLPRMNCRGWGGTEERRDHWKQERAARRSQAKAAGAQQGGRCAKACRPDNCPTTPRRCTHVEDVQVAAAEDVSALQGKKMGARGGFGMRRCRRGMHASTRQARPPHHPAHLFSDDFWSFNCPEPCPRPACLAEVIRVAVQDAGRGQREHEHVGTARQRAGPHPAPRRQGQGKTLGRLQWEGRQGSTGIDGEADRRWHLCKPVGVNPGGAVQPAAVAAAPIPQARAAALPAQVHGESPTRDRQYSASSMRRDRFSTSAAKPATQQEPAMTAPVVRPVRLNPAQAPRQARVQ